ncbi:sulfotransferase family protein [Candidatus Solirubrobacter pratensis]|uniref:sulfotransferase family protein n=1 Tax=Candidatus Solirubrobacter pratensis TaxID=1298857 RepID=UPI000409DD20|nr:sulfotransferase [Candidatus Solirubrobacter pratensis]
MAQNPYLFIVGCPRSGTTLLRRMVDAHPHIAMTRETHWIPKIPEQGIGLTPDGLVTPELLAHLLDDWRFRRMEVDIPRLRRSVGSSGGISYSQFVTLVFDLFGEREGKPLVGDKTPGYGGKIETLHALWATARFVHIIRDGRDVYLSLRDWRPEQFARVPATPAHDAVTSAASFWAGRVQAAREGGRALGSGLYYEVRYESLVAEPDRECRALCRFLDVPEDDAMARFHEGRTRSVPGLDAKKAWLPATKGLRDWRSQMPPEEVERFEATAGGLLKDLGYPILRETAARGRR